MFREIKKHKAEKAELRETIEACKQSIYDLQVELAESTAEVRQARLHEQKKFDATKAALVESSKRQVAQRVEDANKHYARCIKDARNEVAHHAADANRKADQKLVVTRKECERLQLSNQDLHERCAGYEVQLDRLRAQVKVMQEASLRNVEAEHWAPLAVSDIDRKLKAILSDVKQWSVKYATMSLQDMIASPRFHHIGFRLQDESCTSSTQNLLEKLARNTSMIKKPGKAAALLLAALVSSVVMRRIIHDPFFAFVGRGASTLILKSDAEGLEHVFAQLLEQDEVGAHAWRCQLFRLLDPPGAAKSDTAEHAKNIAEKSRREAASQWAEIIMGEAVDVLVPTVDHKAALPGLQSILLRAAELSWAFLARKQSVKVRDIEYLDKDRALRYDHKADDLDTHVFHCPEVEDEPDALDGRKIVLLCNPAVVAYGTADGTDYDKSKIWHKAMVWLG
ncbi:hypothetical protein DOTSEDRAFT_180949 [Dothistroma septosporum NZE10]|uniref:Uncharacterized protein n=1 Tax=Dothistroma septosporum (strain NZE10 / CBS 128990) TaxID=675120 RepID=M2YJ50_DOTSN|nr:hypothetical protein DOTSEDRAFT_180949 [Dothistroma septosporum NZE10]